MYHLDQIFPTKMISKFIVIISLICLSLAAQLPSTSYLPSKQNVGSTQNLGSLHSATSGNNRQTSGNTRAQQEVEKNAVIVQQVQEIEENGFHYAYETSNGIVAEESGNAVQTRGGFAYKGDDGRIYSITFNAGVDGFRPQGDHLPVPPPTPAEILLALKENERDEAAGIFDDGQYHPNSNEKPRRPSKGSVANNQGNIGSHPGY